MASGREVDLSDPAIKPAFDSLKDMKSPNNWLALGFVGKTNKLELVGTGTEGLSGLTAVLAEDRVIFCLLRVIGADVQANVTSNREKFVYISWIGSKVGVMQRAKVGMQSKVVQQYFAGISLAINVDASTQADLELEALAKRLLACGGAHKPTKYVFGPGQEYNLVESGLLGAAGPRSPVASSSEEAKSPSHTESAPPAEAAPTE